MSPDETAWEDGLYAQDDDENLSIDLDPHTSTDNGNPQRPNHHQTSTWLDDEDPPDRALDMTEQNYEEQAAEAAASTSSGRQASQPQSDDEEELEDTFHVDLE